MVFFIYIKATGEVVSKLETTDSTVSLSGKNMGGLEVSRYRYDESIGLGNFIVKEDGLYQKKGKTLVKVELISL